MIKCKDSKRLQDHQSSATNSNVDKIVGIRVIANSEPTTSIARDRADKNFPVSKLELSKIRRYIVLEFSSVGNKISGYVNTRKKNARWFSDSDHQPLSLKHAAMSPVCCLVEQPSEIAFSYAVKSK